MLVAVTVIGPPAVVEGRLELAVIGAPAATLEGEMVLEETAADEGVIDAPAEIVCDPTWDDVLEDEGCACIDDGAGDEEVTDGSPEACGLDPEGAIITPAEVVADGDTDGDANTEVLAACEVDTKVTAEEVPEFWTSD